ncbi:serine/arginine repetitive matrix protein 1-like [Saccostrea echinata]|uniref:serine/arginine repetitive matrix protein 1-like n=1 Tax=Saccostrea echinata TaxID=191078 RepID=UPI002A7FB44A|nr:serine/arginine repetitive matrix protein 1-like [Saccostrea echinata]
MSDSGSVSSRREIVFSYSQGKLLRPRDTVNRVQRRRPVDSEERVIVKRQLGHPSYRTRYSSDAEVPRERRVIRSISNPTYTSRPVRYVIRRPAQSLSSSYSSETGSSTITRSESPSSFTDTSETCSTCSITDSVSSRDQLRSPTIRRRIIRRRQSPDSIEGYEARQFRSREPGSWRIIRRQPETKYVEERARTAEPEYAEVRRIVEPEYAEVRKVREIVRRAPVQDRTVSDDSGSTDTRSEKVLIERGFQNRMREYQSQRSRDVATQMITHFVPPPEEPREEIFTNDAVTQTVPEPGRPPKLPKDRYKTAVIQAESPQKQPNTDDEIEVVVKQDPPPVLTEEVERKPEPPLVQEIDLRPPPPALVRPQSFGPKRKYIPPPPPPPPPDVVIRVGGGWMKEEHHRIQHRPLHRKFQPTADRIPFIRSQFHYSASKTPVVSRERKQTDKIRYASFIP